MREGCWLLSTDYSVLSTEHLPSRLSYGVALPGVKLGG
jgi:hypothetical protein